MASPTTKCSSTRYDDDDWVDTNSAAVLFHSGSHPQALDIAFFLSLFPTKSVEKFKPWIEILHNEEISTVDDLKALSEPHWEMLKLPLGVRAVLQKHIHEMDSHQVATIPQPARRPITQIDVVVIDISCSMKSRSVIDVDKTREDVSKMLFHTLIDKLISLELSHVVGLIAFGERVSPINITTEYEKFHDELGRLDANEGSTKLYDSIFAGAEMIEEYIAGNSSSLDTVDAVMKRIFVLTDGDDNASKRAPWQVSQFLQQKRIILDAIPVAGLNKVLYSMCKACSGLCFDVVSQEQGMNLFEREATLHVAYRESAAADALPPAITDMSVLKSLEPASAATAVRVTDIKSAVPKKVFSPCLTAAEVQVAIANNSTSTAAAGGGSGSGLSAGAMKRVMKEYLELQKTPIDGISVHVSADDSSSWKASMKDLPTPYEGGIWLLTIDFPRDFPFSPPRVKFVTPIYHCNVSPDGHICLDMLRSSWSPALSVCKALQAIKSMILSPNADDPLDAYKAALYRDYINDGSPVYIQQASSHTLAHAGQETYESFVKKYNLS